LCFSISKSLLTVTENEGVLDPAKLAARDARAEKAQKSFGIGKPLVDVTNHTVGATTSAAELQEIRVANKNADWTLIFQVRFSILRNKDSKIPIRFDSTRRSMADMGRALTQPSQMKHFPASLLRLIKI
jgi:hypothetical protein